MTLIPLLLSAQLAFAAPTDGGSTTDGGTADTGDTGDTGTNDTGSTDGGGTDSGTTDGGTTDGGTTDGGTTDGGTNADGGTTVDGGTTYDDTGEAWVEGGDKIYERAGEKGGFGCTSSSAAVIFGLSAVLLGLRRED